MSLRSAEAENSQNTHADAVLSNTPMSKTEVARLLCPPPPLPAKYIGRTQIYGFHFDETWARQRAVITGISNKPNLPTRNFIFWLQIRLSRLSGYKYVFIRHALDDENTPHGAPILVGPTGISQYPILVLTAWEVVAWRNRPTVEQVKIMAEEMELQPQWYVDVAPLGEYPIGPSDYRE